MARFHVMARCGQVEHPLCKLAVEQRVFSRGCRLGSWRCIQSMCPRGHQTFFLFFILDIFVRIAESNPFFTLP
jgi:hypothetical protein